MNIKKHIPNFLTCCNLICGCIGIIICFQDKGFMSGEYDYQNLTDASLLIFLACAFDFFDGFSARLLKVSSPIGKELDSLADAVTFGVLPGIIIYQLLRKALPHQNIPLLDIHPAFIALLIPVFSALRLAKFNIDTRQSDSFIGVPTPTNALLVASFPLILAGSGFPTIKEVVANPYFLIGYAIVMSYLLIAELPLLALKFKNFKWENNRMKYILLISSVVLFVLFNWAGIPMIIFLYILLSVIENKTVKL